MAFTQADLDDVRTQMKAVRATSFSDRSVTNRSMDELLRLEERILNALATEKNKQSFGVASKGF